MMDDVMDLVMESSTGLEEREQLYRFHDFQLVT